MQLYNITAQLRAILEGGEDGELSPEAEAAIDVLQMSLQDKAESICAFHDELERYASAANASAQRLLALASKKQRQADRLKDYLFRELQKLQIKKLVTASFAIRVQANPPGMRPLVDPEQLPLAYQRRPKIEANSLAALQHYRTTGLVPDGFELKQTESLRIS